MKAVFKPKYSAFVASSIDGRISLTAKTLPGWTSKEDKLFLQRSLARMSAVIVGRKTYKAAFSRLRKRTTYVLSSRPKTIHRKGNVTFVNPRNVNLAKLFQKHKRIGVLGGGMVYRFMLEKRMLDEVFITIEPFIFARGVPMFTGGKKTSRLRMISARRLNRQGTLLLHYTISYSKI